jgi:hypothetical protein
MPTQYAARVCFMLLLIASSCKGQVKEHTVIKEDAVTAIAFYNLENLYDPADDPGKSDDEFTPTGANHYTEKVYRAKLHNMAFALSQLAVDKNAEGPALIGLAEIENEKVLRDLVAEQSLKIAILRSSILIRPIIAALMLHCFTILNILK